MSNLRIILVRTSHPGNIGAAARAMKNMNLKNLYLVAPKTFPHAEATARAAGADDILEHAVVVPDLKTALSDCHLAIGTSARSRFLPIEILNPKECATKIATEIKLDRNVAMVFGTENSGLTNDELKLCQYHVQIPTNSEFCSLNVAAAVLILAYEINMALNNSANSNQQITEKPVELATHGQMELLYQHLEETLKASKFLDERNPRLLMQRLRRLFSRIRLETTELNILRGILTSFMNRLHKLSG